MMLMPLICAVMMPAKVASQTLPDFYELFHTWHFASQKYGDPQDTYGKIIQGWYIPQGKKYKVSGNECYADRPIQLQMHLKENSHSYINRIPFIIHTNFSGDNYEKGKYIRCQVFSTNTGKALSGVFHINDGDEYFFDGTDVEYRITGNVRGHEYYQNRWHDVWLPLTGTFGITDLDRITYSTTEGYYDPTNDKTHVAGDWSAAFSWDNTSANKRTDVTNWDGKQGRGSMDPVYEIANGVFTYPASNWKMGLWSGSPYTTQLIVRSEKGNIITMEVGDEDYAKDSYQKKTTKAVGMDAASLGTVNKWGRVDSLCREGNNGWLKLEATAVNYITNPGVTYELKVTCKDASGNPQPFQIGAVRFLESANTSGKFYTTPKDEDDLMGNPHDSWRDLDLDMSWDNDGFKFDNEKYAPSLSKNKFNKFSFFDRGTNLNCIVYANAYTVIGSQDLKHAQPVNVVTGVLADYDHDTGKPTTRVCQELRLTDYNKGVSSEDDGAYYNNNGFLNKYTFTAGKVSYDRSFNTDYATVYLPFALTKAELQEAFGAEACEYKSQDDKNAYFNTITNGTKANEPFMVMPAKSGANLVNLTKKEVPPTPDEATSGMIGVYNYQKIGSGAFMFENDKFMPTASDADLKPFRAYFKPGGSTTAKYFNFVIDNGTEGIDSVQTESGIDSHAPVYSISGQLISENGNRAGLQKGVYIQGNKKFIIK